MAEADDFRNAQAGLDRQEQERVIASAGPCGLVTGTQHRVDLVVGEVKDEGVIVAFGWKRQNAADAVGVFGLPGALIVPPSAG